MASPAEEEGLLEVRCAGCGETLEVERGLTEFACPDCATPQALPPELMPPPRRRRAVPIPPAPAPARAAPPPAGARLPCGACGALLSVPPGLARCGCPVCGAELAVDAARLRRYLAATAAPPLVPVSLPASFQAREVQQEYPDSAVRVGHIQGYPNNRLVHVERSQIRCRNTEALSEYPDAHTGRDDIDTEVSNEINARHYHRSGFSVASRTFGAKRRQVEALNHVTYQVHSQQSNYSVHAEHPEHTIHVREAHNESLNHAVCKFVGHVGLIKETTAVRHTNQVNGTAIDPESVTVEKRQAPASNQTTQDVQKYSSRSIICAEYATVPYQDQVIYLQESQIDPVNHGDNVHMQPSDRISARDGNCITGHSVSHEAIRSKERQIDVVNKATHLMPKQHVDNRAHAEHTVADHSDQMIEHMCHATYGGEECLQKTNGSVAKHNNRQSEHLTGCRNSNMEDRYVEPLKQAMHEAEEQPAYYISNKAQEHVEPPNSGVIRHGNKKIGTRAEPGSTCNEQKWTIPAEQPIFEEQGHAPSVYDTQTQHIEPDLGKQAPRRTQKRKKLLTAASNNRLQLRRSKRLTPESNAVVDTGPLETYPPEQQVASPYQNRSDLPDIDGIIANLCPGSSPQLKMPQLHSTESEPFNVAALPASDPYLESLNEVIEEHGMDKTRTEVESTLIYQRQGKAGSPKLLSPIEQEPEHSDDNIPMHQDEPDMGQLSAKLTHKSMKRNLVSSLNEGIEHRRSKRLAKQSAATTYYESPESDSEESQAASPSISNSLDIGRASDDSSSSLQPQHDTPQRSSNEADSVTMQSASSIPDMSDPESFARYYSKVYPPEVRRALERNSNVWLEPRLIHQSPSSYLHAGGKEKRRRGRGSTLCLKIWTMPEGVRIPVSLNDLGQPIGNEAATLSYFLGTIARDVTLAPLTYTDWRGFPEKNKDVMWHLVNLKFVIAPIGEIWAMKALGKKWKDWRATLKHERYDVHETDEERLADRDARVPEEQWKCLVAYWGTEKAKAASARCRALRARQPVHKHRAGSKSYARIREEESCLRKEAHKRQEGSASGSMDDVFAKIVGPDTRDTKRTYGPVPCTSELRGKTAAKVSLRLAHAAKRNAEEEAATLKKKMMEMEENNRKLQEDLACAKSPASSGVKDRRRMSTDDLQRNQPVNH
uniref:Uncharacterized protein n=1 Tax=Setaria italica TaxID=4555 RepID=K3ZQ58_SETIT